jgi:hypothetical protein
MPATYDSIASTTLTSNTNEINFTNISQTYTDLVLICYGTTSSLTDIKIRVGNNSPDTGTNYGQVRLYGNGSTPTSDRLGPNDTVFYVTGNFEHGNAIISFQNYSNTTTNKSVIIRNSNPNSFVAASVGTWRSTSAINYVRILTTTQNIASGSTFSLYGIQAA